MQQKTSKKMIKGFLIVSTLLLTVTKTQAQQLWLTPQCSFANTQVYNKEDTKGYKHKRGYENPMSMIPTFQMGYGLNVGMSFKKERTGLLAIYTGFGMLPFKQNFKGNYTAPNDNTVATAYTYLNYMSIPLHAKFRIGRSKKIVPTLSAGINMLLLKNYIDEYKITFTQTNGSTFDAKNTIIGNTWESNSGFAYIANMDSWFYNKMVFCSYLSLGVNYHITEKMSVNLGIQNLYSFTDPENRKEISGKFETQLVSFKIKPYEIYVTKFNSRQAAQADDRKLTHLIHTGLQLSFTYKIF